MREAARASILSLPNNGGSARSSYITDDSGSGLHTHQPKTTSGLRQSHYMSDDDDTTEDDEPSGPRRDDNGLY